MKHKLRLAIGTAAAAVTVGGIGLLSPYTLTHTINGMPTASTGEIATYADEVKAQAVAAEEANLHSLESQVKDSMTGYFAEPANALSLPITVSKVALVKASGNMYEGTATMQAGNNTPREIAVHVTADDTNLMWRTDAGAMLPLIWGN